MNAKASAIIAQEFAKGTFDVFDAMLSIPFSHSIGDISDTTPATMVDLLAAYPVAWRASLASGGAVALLFTEGDMGQLVSLVEGTEPSPGAPLDPAQLASLREIADSALGSGLSCVLNKCGLELEQLKNVQVSTGGIDPAVDWSAILGESFVAAPLTFSAAPQFEAAGGFLLFSEQISNLALSLVQPAQKENSNSLLLSQDEMNDIMRTLDPDGIEQAIAARPQPQKAEHESKPPARGPSNMEMVLDIRLVATARLGRVEMPIGDILGLGPGSIIDVGRLVDEPVELLVNNKLIARGDVVVVDEKFGLRITEIIGPKERIESLH